MSDEKDSMDLWVLKKWPVRRNPIEMGAQERIDRLSFGFGDEVGLLIAPEGRGADENRVCLLSESLHFLMVARGAK